MQVQSFQGEESVYEIEYLIVEGINNGTIRKVISLALTCTVNPQTAKARYHAILIYE